MKACVKKLFSLIFILVAFSSCERDRFEEEASMFNLTLQVFYPDYYSIERADQAIVKLTNISNNLTVEKLADASGQVSFDAVIKGRYRLSIIKKIDALSAQQYGETLVTEQHINDNKLVNLTYSIQELSLFEETDLGSVHLNASLPGDLLLKEVYYAGSFTPNYKSYWSDLFVEIYNNTQVDCYADSICVGLVYGSNGSATSSIPSEYQSDDENVYLYAVWMIPGDGNSVLFRGGQSIVVAQDGMNHRDDPNGNPNSIDLSMADFETFLERDEQRDVDVVSVPNMTEIFMANYNSHDWIMKSQGEAVVIFRLSDLNEMEFVPYPNDTQGKQLLKVPINIIYDAFEGLANAESGEFKRIPAALDNGFAFCSGIFNMQSCRRIVESKDGDRYQLQDTNNSSVDFELISFPTPKVFE